jgi:SAM-dependent methyltransferase
MERWLLNLILGLGRFCRPRTLALEAALRCHNEYEYSSCYGYDLASKQRRASERLALVGKYVNLSMVRSAVDIGSGDGRLALEFLQRGCRVAILDVADWRDADVKASEVCFVQIHENATYPLPDNSADLVVSFNTFEHIEEPRTALWEMLRITRPGGYLFLDFDPIYNSPLGLHSFQTFRAPYSQFVLSKVDLDWFIRQNGICDLGASRASLQSTNGWSIAQYRTLFAEMQPSADLLVYEEGRTTKHLGFVWRHLRCFLGRGLNYDELTIHRLRVCLQKH